MHTKQTIKCIKNPVLIINKKYVSAFLQDWSKVTLDTLSIVFWFIFVAYREQNWIVALKKTVKSYVFALYFLKKTFATRFNWNPKHILSYFLNNRSLFRDKYESFIHFFHTFNDYISSESHITFIIILNCYSETKEQKKTNV